MPAEGGQPPPGGPGDQQPPPPQGGEGNPNGANEIIFPNLRSWKEDLYRRAGILNTSIIINPTDDEDTIKMKREAGENMKQISMRMMDRRLMENKNQRVIANQFAELEEKMSMTGRKLFGIKWNTTPCGAGFVQANCGKLAPCQAGA